MTDKKNETERWPLDLEREVGDTIESNYPQGCAAVINNVKAVIRKILPQHETDPAEGNTEAAAANKLLTIKEVATRLDMADKTVRKYINENKLNAVRISERTIRVHPDELERFLANPQSRQDKVDLSQIVAGVLKN